MCVQFVCFIADVLYGMFDTESFIGNMGGLTNVVK